MSEKELKPCPFCGSNAYMDFQRCDLHSVITYYVKCEGCGSKTDTFGIKDRAAKKWNARNNQQLADLKRENEQLKSVDKAALVEAIRNCTSYEDLHKDTVIGIIERHFNQLPTEHKAMPEKMSEHTYETMENWVDGNYSEINECYQAIRQSIE